MLMLVREREENPALAAFLDQLEDMQVLGEVLIRKRSKGFELRHSADADALETNLTEYRLADLRKLVDFTSDGRFRPLKAAPNLRRGWRLRLVTASDLANALDRLYPGVLADWHAAREGRAAVTDFRTFMNRQSGMYRVAQQLSDRQAAMTIRACCHPRHCLKRRLWGLEGHSRDVSNDEEGKGIIPCLEPCAILLEFARTAIRLEQTERHRLEMTDEEIETLQTALTEALSKSDSSIRYGDFSAPGNPRRLELALEKLRVDGLEKEGGVKQLSIGAKEAATFRYALAQRDGAAGSAETGGARESRCKLLLEKIDGLVDSGKESEETMG